MTPDDPSESVVVTAERMVAGGEALARDDEGRIVFVRAAAPGDRLEVAITQDRTSWRRGEIAHVVDAGAQRVRPPCEIRRRGCGGCDWQHLDEEAQLPAKREVVVDALRRTARLPDAVVTTGRSVPAAGYRTTLRVVGGPGGRASLRSERSHETVELTDCLVAHPVLRDVLPQLEIPDGVEVTIRVSAATGEITGYWDARRGHVGGWPVGAGTGGRAALTEHVAGHDLRVSAGSFFQSGPAAADLLVDAVARAAPELADASLVVDAYAGVGLFAAVATPASASVITIESSRSAVDDSRVNLAGRDAVVHLGQVSGWRPDHRHAGRIDVVVADPARSGLGRSATAALAAAEPPVIVLVSCDPVAMARDSALLARHGYRHAGTEVLDLFPHTHHVECVTRFERALAD